MGDVDVNEDGTVDVVVGAYRDGTMGEEAGAIHVYYGASWGSVLTPADADLSMYGASAGDRFGHVLASPGDLDSDGTDDLLAGALFASPTLSNQGGAYLLLSPDVASGVGSDVAWQAYGDAASDLFGDALGFGRGDIDGDGHDDFAVGAQGSDVSAGGNEGRVYVWRGR